MNELFKLFGTIAVNNSDANKAIDETTGKAEDSGNKLGGMLEKVGGIAVKAGAAVAAGIGAMATGISVLSKQSLDAYADYEQLVGGVETLFGAGGNDLYNYAKSVGKSVLEVHDKYNDLMKAQDTVLENSQNAFRTCGLSANEYMETVTSFSASLIASLDGDTVKAATKADQVLVQMADNANKMGSSMESIQNAYNGFAKQNYTMLDNLKLGYGGTKEEMQRLLADAEKMPEALGRKFDISNYADIVDAIKLVQDNMGITGTTAKEASETISGSVAMMKASWSNFLTSLGDDSDLFDSAVEDLVGSAITVANNIAPRLIKIVPRLVEGLMQVAEEISPYLSQLIEELLPVLLDGAVNLVVSVIENLPVILELLGTSLWTALQNLFGQLFGLLPDTVTEGISSTFEPITSAMGDLATTWEIISTGISELFGVLFDVLKTTWETIGVPIWDAIQYAITLVAEAFGERLPEIQATFTSTVESIKDAWENHLKPALTAIGNFLKTVLKPVFEVVFKGFILPLVDMVFGSIKRFWESVLLPVFNGICDFLTGVFTANWELAFKGIVSIVKGAVNAVIGGLEWMVNMAIESINKILAGISAVATAVGSLFGLNPVSLSLDYVTLPRLEKGGILEKGQLGLLEGNGAEAVVPLDQNRKWISAVSSEMNTQGIGGGSESISLLKEVVSQLQIITENLPEEIRDSIESGLKLNVNNREFARLVKAVN